MLQALKRQAWIIFWSLLAIVVVIWGVVLIVGDDNARYNCEHKQHGIYTNKGCLVSCIKVDN